MLFGDPALRAWDLDETAATHLVATARDRGVNFFDTGNTYAGGLAERLLGRALKAVARREDVIIATKVYFPTGDGPHDRGLSRPAILNAIDNSLRRLGTDYVDLYIAHRWDPLVPAEETLAALDEVVRAGKARALGASSMFAWQFMKALGLQTARDWSPFVCMQSHYNLLYREEEREMLPLCRDQGVAVTAWSPLARGILADATDATATDARLANDRIAPRYSESGGKADVLSAARILAARRGVAVSQLALAWLWSKPGVAGPILGATKPEHLRSAVAALDLRLDAEEGAALERSYRPLPVIGHGEEDPFNSPRVMSVGATNG